MTYGFIGCGNMGGAIARALRKSTANIFLSDRSGKAKALAQELEISYTDNQTIASNCDRIFLGVKPHMMADMLAPLQPTLAAKKPLLITMAAGLTLQQIEKFAGTALPIIRIMPNTPTAVGKGITLYCSNELTDKAVLEGFLAELTAEYIEAFGSARNAMFRLKENWGFLRHRFEGSDKLWKQLRKTTDIQEFRSITAEILKTLPLTDGLNVEW